jgi:hypothetical protein
MQLTEILALGGHDVDMLVSTAYNKYEHHVAASITTTWVLSTTDNYKTSNRTVAASRTR